MFAVCVPNSLQEKMCIRLITPNMKAFQGSSVKSVLRDLNGIGHGIGMSKSAVKMMAVQKLGVHRKVNPMTRTNQVQTFF